MRSFYSSELKEIEALLALALEEDRVGSDATSRTIFAKSDTMSANIVAREELVFCGVEVLPLLLLSCSDAKLDFKVRDGEKLAARAVIANLSGPTTQLLALERTVLNILQRLCGVATATHKYVQAIVGTNAIILDTRKTIPGWRALDKYAVRSGGGQNHRMHLADAIMLKDNHIAAAGSLKAAIEEALGKKAEENLPIIVECDTLEQVEYASKQPVDRLLLDNMSIDELRRAVEMVAGKVPLEASGGITLETVGAVAQTGVNYISVGAITHAARNVDIALDKC